MMRQQLQGMAKQTVEMSKVVDLASSHFQRVNAGMRLLSCEYKKQREGCLSQLKASRGTAGQLKRELEETEAELVRVEKEAGDREGM